MIELTMTPEHISFDISGTDDDSVVEELDKAIAYLEHQRIYYIEQGRVGETSDEKPNIKDIFDALERNMSGNVQSCPVRNSFPPTIIDNPLRVCPGAHSIRVKREGRIGCLPVPPKTYLHCPDGEVPLAEYLNRVLNEFPELNGYLDVVKGGIGDLYCFEFTSSNGIQCLIEPGMWITIHGHEFEIHR